MPYLTLLPHKFGKTCNAKIAHSPPGPKGSYLSWPGPLRDLKGRPTFNGTIRDLKLASPGVPCEGPSRLIPRSWGRGVLQGAHRRSLWYGLESALVQANNKVVWPGFMNDLCFIWLKWDPRVPPDLHVRLPSGRVQKHGT